MIIIGKYLLIFFRNNSLLYFNINILFIKLSNCKVLIICTYDKYVYVYELYDTGKIDDIKIKTRKNA